MDMEKIENWGFTDLTKTQWIGDQKCINCRVDLTVNWHSKRVTYDNIIGFTTVVILRPLEKHSATDTDRGIKGTFILRCPNRHKLYWFPADNDFIENMIDFKKWPY